MSSLMKIKGTAIRSIPEFIKKQHPGQYDNWVNSLPPESAKIFKGIIVSGGWYPLTDTLTIPLKTIARTFYNGNYEKTARVMGQYSADDALNGIYKFFVKFGSPKSLIDRSSSLMKTYFDPSEIEVIQGGNKEFSVRITKFPEPDEIIEWNIAGWVERALEISGCKNVNATLKHSLSKGHKYSEIVITWE
jgi:hypothetical protein